MVVEFRLIQYRLFNVTKFYTNLLFSSTIFVFLVSALFVSQISSVIIVNKIAGAALLPLWLAFSQRLTLNPLVLCYVAFIGWCLLSLPGSGGKWVLASDHLRTMLQLAVVLFLISNLFYESNSLVPLATIMVGYFFVAYFGDLLGIQVDPEQSRLKGVTANPNTLGFICLYGLIGSLYLVEKLNILIFPFLREQSWLLFVVFAILIMPTGSRKSFVSLAGVFVIHTLLQFQGNSKRVLTLLIVLGVGLIAASDQIFGWFEGSDMGQRFLDKSKLEGGANLRASLYEQGFQLVAKNPIFGVGLNNFQSYSKTGHVAHSYYIEILAGTGVIGFVILFSGFIWLFRRAWRLFRQNIYLPEAVFIISLLGAISVMSLGFSYHKSIDQWVFLVLIASFLESNWVKPYVQYRHPGLHSSHMESGAEGISSQ